MNFNTLLLVNNVIPTFAVVAWGKEISCVLKNNINPISNPEQSIFCK
jgi:hypothetical protein